MTWVVLCLMLLIALIIQCACKSSQKCCNRAAKWLVLTLMWGPLLRTSMETFLELVLCSFINIAQVRFSLYITLDLLCHSCRSHLITRSIPSLLHFASPSILAH